MSNPTFPGRCFCGQVRFELSGKPVFACHCHCESCRRAAGAPFVTWISFGRDEFALMEPHAWIVNVARGRHVVTDHLVEALSNGTIGGAGLEVTDPEPLPDGHPLWALENCIITPHTGTTPEMSRPLLAARVEANVRRFAAGEELLGPVDLDAGY